MKTRLNNMERNETPSFEGDERRARILTWAFAIARAKAKAEAGKGGAE